MYSCKLHIMIFSQNSLLEKIAKSMVAHERFSHIITCPDKFSNESLCSGDLVIIDLPLNNNLQDLKELRKLCKKNALLIVCAAAENISALDDVSLEAAFEFWEKPLDNRLTRLRFEKLLSYIKLKKDFALSNIYLDGLNNSIPDMVWFKDLKGLHLKLNNAFCDMVGKTMEDATGRDHCYIWNVSPNDPDSGEQACKDSEEIVVQQNVTCQFTEKVKSLQGMRQFKTYKTPLFDEDGQIMGTVGIGHDVTDLENLGTELEIFLRSMPFAVLLWNEKNIITNANEKFEKFFAVCKENVLGKNYSDWLENAFEEEKTINEEGFIEARTAMKNPEDSSILEMHVEPIFDVFQNIVGHLCIYRDVTIERKLEAQILENSNTDFLTGLPNRRSFYQFIHNNQGEVPISLLSIDLDNFKKVNDTFGHHIGDKALIYSANILRSCFLDEFISRVGGDEFLVAKLGDCSIEELKAKAQMLLNSMKLAFTDYPQFNILSASIGISQTHDPNMDIDLLIQKSDAALYAAKLNGKAQYYVAM